MSERIAKRPRTASTAGDVEHEVSFSGTNPHYGSSSVASSRPIPRIGRAASMSSAAGISSLPSRSYIHHAIHGSQEVVQYSSFGVREQTAELSSSFLSDSDIDQQFSPERTASTGGIAPYRQHETIAEGAEPESPTGSAKNAPASSELTTALLKRKPSDIHTKSAQVSSNPDATYHSDVTVPQATVTGESEMHATEETPLLPQERLSSLRKQDYDPGSGSDGEATLKPGIRANPKYFHHVSRGIRAKLQYLAHPKKWNLKQLVQRAIFEPVAMIPAVFLGLLLNLLDALSYGIILFPLGEEIFKDMGADGVSMYYVSCIVSQLVFSTGSVFKGGVGSEMIEVVPFFHKMTYLIMAKMQSSSPDEIRATVITCYALSSILTGIIFFGLGAARLGTLVNFFPHSILTGCIGGVGIFLFITGIEVSARLNGNLDLTLPVLQKLFSLDTIVLWIPPLLLAIALIVTKHYFDRSWLVPAYYIAITAIFYIITTAVPSITMSGLRQNGWVFDAPAAGVPFYNFYSYYQFKLVSWQAIWQTVPSMLALCAFGVLHVPINVPNLAMVVQEDNVSTNRELLMHGISNTLSGCVGSIQNYLVFVNSVLFMDTGGNSRLAGYMLAAATFGLWVAGPVVIGYVPVMVVGTLIYYLGIDLAKEALVATYGRLSWLEYLTIVTIALVMGLHDFVVGIAIGIGLACLVYVVQTSRKTAIRAEFSGAVAESTVRRHPRARKYLHKVGPQIRVVKLGGFLFFGSIVDVEKKVRKVVEHSVIDVRYLIIELTHVTGIDFSAAEAFGRMNRILNKRNVQMAMAGVSLESEVGRSLSMVGLFDESDDQEMPSPKVYEDLNGALEACENELLLVLTEKQKSTLKGEDTPPIPVPEMSPQLPMSPFDSLVGSPRRALLDQAATTTLSEAPSSQNKKWHNFKQPLPLLMQAFQDLTQQDEAFWFRAVPYYVRREFTRGQMVYARGDDPDGFYLLQSGILRAEYLLEQGAYNESVVAGTTCGELPFFSGTERTCSVIAEQDCIAWLLTPEKWDELQIKDGEVAKELLKVGMKLSAERMNAITSYVLITAS